MAYPTAKGLPLLAPIIKSLKFLNIIPRAKLPFSFLCVFFTAIIATNSDERYRVTKSLLKKEVQYIIFEKVLFQNPNEYLEIEKDLQKYEIKSWINCWRRSATFFQELKNVNQFSNIISLSVKGNKWGMASNAIHVFDLLNYLTDYTDYQLTENNIEVISSKRSKYKEFVGLIKGTFGSGTTSFSFESHNTLNDIFLEIILEYANKTITINGGQGWWIEKTSHQKEIKHTIKLPNQSELTHLHIEDFSERGDCSLTPFSKSFKLHLPMIDYFTKIFQASGIKGCPIT